LLQQFQAADRTMKSLPGGGATASGHCF